MSGTEVYQYDSLGNLIVAWYPDGRQAEFAYDTADNRTQVAVTQSMAAPVASIVQPVASEAQPLTEDLGPDPDPEVKSNDQG